MVIAWNKISDLLGKGWKSPYTGYLIWIASAGLCGYFLIIKLPSPGVAAVILGVVLAIIPLRGELTLHQKVCFSALMIALVVVEWRAISAEHHANEQELARQELEKLQEEGKLQKNFDAAQQKMDRIFSQEQEALNNITGGDSFPFIWVWPVSETVDRLPNGAERLHISLDIRNRGKYPLSGLTITSVYAEPYKTKPNLLRGVLATLAIHGRKPGAVVQLLRPNGYQTLDIDAMPVLSPASPRISLTYKIQANNGQFAEIINFGLLPDKSWAWSGEVFKTQLSPDGSNSAEIESLYRESYLPEDTTH